MREELTLGWFGWIILTKFHVDLEDSTFPISAFLSRNARFPNHNVTRTITFGSRTCVKAKLIRNIGIGIAKWPNETKG